MKETIWNGIDPLEIGHVVRIKRDLRSSNMYHIPEAGQQVTIIARDKQDGHTPVWIVRWYNADLTIQLTPIMSHCLEAACTEEALAFIAAFQQATGLTLTAKDVQKTFDILQEKQENTSNDLVEVTILSSADCKELDACSFPFTFKLSEKDIQTSGSCVGIPRWLFDCVYKSQTEASEYDIDDPIWFLNNKEISISNIN